MLKKIKYFSFLILVTGFIACTSNKYVKIPLNSTLQIKASIVKPEGKGPFPALVFMHGCGGVNHYYFKWASLLKKWGFVSLIVDSLEPRGVDNVCTQGTEPIPTTRLADALAGRNYLLKLPYVQKDKIGLIGWSHGGVVALLAALNITKGKLKFKGAFKAVIAFYPYCAKLKEKVGLKSPLLVLIGDKDNWTPAHLCKTLKKDLSGTIKMTLKIYSGAFHCFDWEGLESTLIFGHMVKGDDEAIPDARKRVKAFLQKHLK